MVVTEKMAYAVHGEVSDFALNAVTVLLRLLLCAFKADCNTAYKQAVLFVGVGGIIFLFELLSENPASEGKQCK